MAPVGVGHGCGEAAVHLLTTRWCPVLQQSQMANSYSGKVSSYLFDLAWDRTVNTDMRISNILLQKVSMPNKESVNLLNNTCL